MVPNLLDPSGGLVEVVNQLYPRSLVRELDMGARLRRGTHHLSTSVSKSLRESDAMQGDTLGSAVLKVSPEELYGVGSVLGLRARGAAWSLLLE